MWTADSFVQDVSAGAWVHEGLSRFADGHRGHLVGDVVPPVFEAYARAPVSVDGLSVVPEELLRVASAQLTPSRLARGPLSTATTVCD